MTETTNTTIDSMVDDKELRQKYIDRTEVLDKVKALMLIPTLDMMSARQIADFYEVDIHVVQVCYQRNKKEIDGDGTIVKKPLDFAKISKDTGCDFRQQVAVNVLEFDGVQIVISNRGLRCFSKRAVLRFGMLLRDSAVAQEVRTQLLNIVDHAEEEKPEILIQDIENEQELLMNIGKAYASGDVTEVVKAMTTHAAYLNRRNEKLKEANAKLTEQNENLTDENTALTNKNESLTTENQTLAKDNDILAGHILEWSNRSSANKIVRAMAAELKWDFRSAWGEVYNELLYRYGISLKTRRALDGRASLPLLAFLRDDEYEKLYKAIAAMLQARYVNPSRIFAKAKMTM